MAPVGQRSPCTFLALGKGNLVPCRASGRGHRAPCPALSKGSLLPFSLRATRTDTTLSRREERLRGKSFGELLSGMAAFAQRDKVQGVLCSTGATTFRNPARRGAQGQRGRHCANPEAPLSNPARRGALGRRGREADPDSRSASERGGSAKREKPREQGRRHLAVNSQVSDKAARSAEGAGGFERTAFQDAFASFKRKIGRFSKTLENISFRQTSAVLTRDSRPAQGAALSAFCASKPSRPVLPATRRTHSQGRPPSPPFASRQKHPTPRLPLP